MASSKIIKIAVGYKVPRNKIYNKKKQIYKDFATEFYWEEGVDPLEDCDPIQSKKKILHQKIDPFNKEDPFVIIGKQIFYCEEYDYVGTSNLKIPTQKQIDKFIGDIQISKNNFGVWLIQDYQ